jgi:hypothetical protein
VTATKVSKTKSVSVPFKDAIRPPDGVDQVCHIKVALLALASVVVQPPDGLLGRAVSKPLVDIEGSVR